MARAQATGQLHLPLRPEVVSSAVERRRRHRRAREAPAHRTVQLVIASPVRARRHRPVNPFAAANALAMQHLDIADKVAANLSHRTGHPLEDLRQIPVMGILQAARRYTPDRGDFRPYARTYANGEVYHFLRDKGFLIKVPASWRELHARGLKLLRLGVDPAEVPKRLGVSAERWREMVLACSQRVVAYEVEAE